MHRFKRIFLKLLCVFTILNATGHAEYAGSRVPEWKEAWDNTITLIVFKVIEEGVSDEARKPYLKEWIRSRVLESEKHIVYKMPGSREKFRSQDIDFKGLRQTIAELEKDFLTGQKQLKRYLNAKKNDALSPATAYRELYQTAQAEAFAVDPQEEYLRETLFEEAGMILILKAQYKLHRYNAHDTHAFKSVNKETMTVSVTPDKGGVVVGALTGAIGGLFLGVKVGMLFGPFVTIGGAIIGFFGGLSVGMGGGFAIEYSLEYLSRTTLLDFRALPASRKQLAENCARLLLGQ